jgi:hypothetical protein
MDILEEVDQPGTLIDNYVTQLNFLLSRKAVGLVSLLARYRAPTLRSTMHHVSVPGSVVDTHRANKMDIKNYTFINKGETHYKVHIR